MKAQKITKQLENRTFDADAFIAECIQRSIAKVDRKIKRQRDARFEKLARQYHYSN